MYKHFNHEGGNCSPLLAYWPKGISKDDRWVRSPVHLIDFMPTILEVAQGEYPESHGGEEIHPLEGRSLVPFFKGAGEASERVLCFDHFESSAHSQRRLETGSRKQPLQKPVLGALRPFQGSVRNGESHK